MMLSLTTFATTLGCIFATVMARGVTDFVLVDTQTGRDLMLLLPETIIDTSVYGDQLSVRVETDSSEDTIKVDLDNGSSIRMERSSPIYLAGTQKGKALDAVVPYPSNALVRPGKHTLRACVVDFAKAASRKLNSESDQGDGCLVVAFETRNGKKGDTTTDEVEATSAYDVPPTPTSVYGQVSGELRQWHKVTIGFRGPPASETGMTVPGIHRAPTPFADYRLDVAFVHDETGKQFVVPGYYATDGNAANNHSVSGSVWVVHFTPPLTGRYRWKAKFTEGTYAAVLGIGNPGHFFDGALGSFEVQSSDKTDISDIRSTKGRLTQTDEGNLQFADGTPYDDGLGANATIDLLEYSEFDVAPAAAAANSIQRPSLKSYEKYYSRGQGRTFANGKGTELMGAINYIASKGTPNVVTATVLQGNRTFPFRSTTNLLQFDVSKLEQWGAMFDYASEKGLLIQMFLGDNHELLQHGDMYERTLYFREMIARFGHIPAIVWNLEQDVSSDNWPIQSKIALLRELDPYESTPIRVRTPMS